MVAPHQYGISASVPQMSFRRETSVEAFYDLVGVSSNCFMGLLWDVNAFLLAVIYKKISLHGAGDCMKILKK